MIRSIGVRRLTDAEIIVARVCLRGKRIPLAS